MTPDQIQAALERIDACERVLEWAEGRTLAELYHSDKGYYLYRSLVYLRLPSNAIVQLAIDAARLALPSAGELRAVALRAIVAAENLLKEPSEANAYKCKQAANEADGAALKAEPGILWVNLSRPTRAAHAASEAGRAAWTTDAAYASGAASWAFDVIGDAPLADCFRARIPEEEFVRLATEAIDRILNQP